MTGMANILELYGLFREKNATWTMKVTPTKCTGMIAKKRKVRKITRISTTLWPLLLFGEVCCVGKKKDDIIVYRHAIWKNYENKNADLKTEERGWMRPGQKAEQDTTPNLDGT
jgi:hypothetical protein